MEAASSWTPAKPSSSAPEPTSTPAATGETALQLLVELEALLVELRGALSDPGHEEDMGALNERKGEVGEAANAALQGDLGADQRAQVEELLGISERVLRRRRVLRG